MHNLTYRYQSTSTSVTCKT